MSVFFYSILLIATLMFLNGNLAIDGNYDIIIDKIHLAKEDKEYRNSTLKFKRINQNTIIVDSETDWKFDCYPGMVMVDIEVGRQSQGNNYDNIIGKFAYEYCTVHMANLLKEENKNNTNDPGGCPKKKGHYYTYNSNPRPKNLPAYIPFGKYRVKISHMMGKKCIYMLLYYGTIQKKNAIRSASTNYRGRKNKMTG